MISIGENKPVINILQAREDELKASREEINEEKKKISEREQQLELEAKFNEDVIERLRKKELILKLFRVKTAEAPDRIGINVFHREVFYIPGEDVVVCDIKPDHEVDLSEYYQTKELNEGFVDGFNIKNKKYASLIKNAADDVRSRIQDILIHHKGLEDWSVLTAMLLNTYNN